MVPGNPGFDGFVAPPIQNASGGLFDARCGTVPDDIGRIHSYLQSVVVGGKAQLL
jgi:hypothetical protein